MTVEPKEIDKSVVNAAISAGVAAYGAALAGLWAAPWLRGDLRAALIGLWLLLGVAGVLYFFRLGGAGAEGASPARVRYLAFRARLAAGGTPASLYAASLECLLDGVDRFFGDAGRADESWFTRTLGWEAKGARWSAAAYDRCLLLALIYPVASVLVIWVLFNKVGVTEHALRLREAPAWGRWGLLGALLLEVSALNLSRKTSVWKSVTFLAISLCSVAVAFVVARSGAIVAAVVLALPGAGAGAATVGLAIGLVGAGAFAFALAGVFAGVGAIVIALVIAFPFVVAVVFAVAWLMDFAQSRSRLGLFLWLFSLALAALCLAVASQTDRISGWAVLGPFVLFVGLFTVVNAPFDWLALGLTRALLRRGLSPRSWSPFFYAALDLAAAVALMFGLAFALVFAAQIFDDFAALSGDEKARILPLPKLFAELKADPAAPEVLWVWALMFSSMIPSLLNAVAAGAALLRGLPSVHRRILARLPEQGAIDNETRFYLALGLAGHVAFGAALALAAFALLVYGLFPLALPTVGRWLLVFADRIAAADLPGLLMAAFGRR